jgi:hypothetical protein
MAKHRERSTPRQRHQRHAREDLTEARDCARCHYTSVKSPGSRDCHCSSPASPNHAVVVHTSDCDLLLRILSCTSLCFVALPSTRRSTTTREHEFLPFILADADGKELFVDAAALAVCVLRWHRRVSVDPCDALPARCLRATLGSSVLVHAEPGGNSSDVAMPYKIELS